MEQPKSNFKIVSDKKARMILPNAITLIGVCIGLTSIKFALDGRFSLAVIAILFAGLMDALDGRIARLIKGTSKMGILHFLRCVLFIFLSTRGTSTGAAVCD